MKVLLVIIVLLSIIFQGCGNNKTEKNFELSYNNKKLVEGGLDDTIPMGVWNYYSEEGNLLVKKAFYNSEEKPAGQADLMFFDEGRLVYFKGRFSQSYPNSENWGEVITEYYCGSCHQMGEPSIAVPLESMTSYGKQEFYQRLTKAKHFKESESKVDFSEEAKEGFDFLTREDTDRILEYIKSNSVLPVE